MAAQHSSSDRVSECGGERRLDTWVGGSLLSSDVPSSVEWLEQPSKGRPDMPISIFIICPKPRFVAVAVPKVETSGCRMPILNHPSAGV